MLAVRHNSTLYFWKRKKPRRKWKDKAKVGVCCLFRVIRLGIAIHACVPKLCNRHADQLFAGADKPCIVAPVIPVDLFDDFGLTEVGRLADWELSSYKPGCGVEELKHESADLFWQ